MPRVRTPVVLVVDDERSIRELASTVLGRDGVVALTASSAHEALRFSRMHRERIDLLVTDVHLGDGDGITLAEKVRLERPGVAVLVISGRIDNRVRAEAKGYTFLAKPFGLPAFLEALRQALPEVEKAA